MSTMPTLFVSHGAPTFALAPGLLGPQLTALGASLPRPTGVVILSPHWMTPGLRVGSSARPATVHDFSGFEQALYAIEYPAPGSLALAERVAQLVRDTGATIALDGDRGFDHGAWVPMRFVYPDASVPVVQLSMPATLDADGAYRLGQMLAPLRDEQVLLVGSGSLTHNLFEFRLRSSAEADYAKAFAAWAREVVESHDHAALLRTMTLAPHAARAHPTLEHLVPLMFAAGAAGPEAPVEVLEGGITHGVLAMDSYLFGSVEA